MIDTIHLRINNISKYRMLYEQLYTIKRDSVSEAYIDQETGEMLSSRSFVRSLIYHDNNNIIPLNKRSSLDLPSSHYSVSYVVNVQGNYVDFNFSLPKTLYGTNLFQFVDYYSQSCDVTFALFIRYIFDFARDYFIQLPEAQDMEVRRIDLCYNQFFNSKSDALQYLDHQKTLLVKYARKSQNNYRSYETSLMYVTARYSFKIYHKGTEFAKHDYKALVKSGNSRGYDLGYFQDVGDKILRYEMTFRLSYINYLFNSYFFDSERRGNRVDIQTHPVNKVLKAFVTFGFSKYYSYFKTKQKTFSLESDYDSYSTNRKNFEVYKDNFNVTFDYSIFSILYEQFWNRVKQYQLNVKMSIGQVVDNITEYNKSCELKNRIRRAYDGKQVASELVNSRMVILAILSQYVNLQELYKAKLIPKSTYYRIREDLKKVGISEYSANTAIPTPPLDYLDYKYYFGRYLN